MESCVCVLQAVGVTMTMTHSSLNKLEKALAKLVNVSWRQ